MHALFCVLCVQCPGWWRIRHSGVDATGGIESGRSPLDTASRSRDSSISAAVRPGSGPTSVPLQVRPSTGTSRRWRLSSHRWLRGRPRSLAGGRPQGWSGPRSIRVPVLVARLGRRRCRVDQSGEFGAPGPVAGLESDTQRELIDIHHDMASELRACSRASASTGSSHRAEIGNLVSHPTTPDTSLGRAAVFQQATNHDGLAINRRSSAIFGGSAI
jgi:hypothetical protein